MSRRKVVCVQWEESERGWGIRPDGYSLHLCILDAIAYIQKHKDQLQKQYGKKVPYEYERPAGDPYHVYVSEQVHKDLLDNQKRGGKGIRSYERKYPEPVVKSHEGPWRTFK